MGRPRKKTPKKSVNREEEKDEGGGGGLLMSMRSGLKEAVGESKKPKNKGLELFWNIVTGVLVLFVAAVWLRRCGVIDWGKPRRGAEPRRPAAALVDAGVLEAAPLTPAPPPPGLPVAPPPTSAP